MNFFILLKLLFEEDSYVSVEVDSNVDSHVIYAAKALFDGYLTGFRLL
jgi:hypothetical protein